jgi:hypothetical protein
VARGERGVDEPAGWCFTNGFGGFSLAAIWNLDGEPYESRVRRGRRRQRMILCEYFVCRGGKRGTKIVT